VSDRLGDKNGDHWAHALSKKLMALLSPISNESAAFQSQLLSLSERLKHRVCAEVLRHMTLSQAFANFPVSLHAAVVNSIVSSEGSVYLHGLPEDDWVTTTTFFSHLQGSSQRHRPPAARREPHHV
jgi:hypothetical protein